MNNPPDVKKSRLVSRMLLATGICLVAAGLLGPALADLMPIHGFDIPDSSTQRSYRIVPTVGDVEYLESAMVFVGLAIIIAGMLVRRRSR